MTNIKMNFSVLMSLYHKEQSIFLNSAFTSIWDNQSIQPDQIVLVIDGEIGTQLQNCIEYWKNRIGDILTIVKLPHNVGLGEALNIGLQYCNNDWVFRMDTDDICVADRFEKQICYIQAHPEIVLLGGQITEFNHQISDAINLKPVPISQQDILKFSLVRNPFNHMTVAYKKSVILQLGGYQHHLYMEDYNLWLRIISGRYTTANLPDILVYARIGNGMHARRKGIQYIKSEYQLLQLKKQLKLQSSIPSHIFFILRISFRLLPTNFLKFIYNTLLRKSIKTPNNV